MESEGRSFNTPVNKSTAHNILEVVMIYVLTKKAILGTGEAIENAVIAVENGKIVEITSRVPDGASLLDWSEYVVTPGFIDAHEHLTIDMGDEEAQSKESLPFQTIKAIRNAKTILSAGITTLRDVGAKDFIDIELRDAIERGDILGPRLLVSGQFITSTGGHAWYFTDEVDGPTAVRKMVRKQVKNQVDLIKIMVSGGVGTPNSIPTVSGFSRDEIFAAVEEAHAHGKKISGHIHGGPGAAWAIEAGLDTLEHGVFLTSDDLALMEKHGTFLICTWRIMEASLESDQVPEFFKIKAHAARESYGKVLREAVERGIPIAIGGDTWHGDVAGELKALVAAGMTNHAALRAATQNGAEALGISEEAGTLEAGKYADLVALLDDPLEDVANVAKVAAVMKQGIVVSD